MPHRKLITLLLVLSILPAIPAPAQEKSINPDINKTFENPDLDVEQWVKRFEVESREIYHDREKIVAACGLKPGMSVADVGAGTGLFTRLFAREVGDTGRVYAVDIAKKFIDHIEKTASDDGLKNITSIVCTEQDSKLPADSIDLAFICDTYHHFEFPQKTMASIHRALRPGGRVVLVDFKRIEGVSSDWTLHHVRAGQEVFTKEIEAAGFKEIAQPKILKENYCVIFQKLPAAAEKP